MKRIKREDLSAGQLTALRIVSVIVFLAFIGFFTWVIGKPIIEFANEPERFKNWVDTYGIWGRLTFVLMVFIQVVVALIPGEPLEMVAGYAFGGIEGTILCVIGITLGSFAVLLLVKKFGMRFVGLFFNKKEIKHLKFLEDTKKRNLLIFFLFFLPGTPKDLLTYFVGLTDIKMWHYLIIVSVARLPSIIGSTFGAEAISFKNYKAAIVILAVTFLLSAIGFLIYKNIKKFKNRK